MIVVGLRTVRELEAVRAGLVTRPWQRIRAPQGFHSVALESPNGKKARGEIIGAPRDHHKDRFGCGNRDQHDAAVKDTLLGKMIDPGGQSKPAIFQSVNSNCRRSSQAKIDHQRVCRWVASQTDEVVVLADGQITRHQAREPSIYGGKVRCGGSVQGRTDERVQAIEGFLLMDRVLLRPIQPRSGQFRRQPFKFRGGTVGIPRARRGPGNVRTSRGTRSTCKNPTRTTRLRQSTDRARREIKSIWPATLIHYVPRVKISQKLERSARSEGDYL